MITMATISQILKDVYRGPLANQLNTETDPLYNAIASTTEDIRGKQVVKAAPFGINGGIGAGAEAGPLPKSNGNQYQQFVSDLKNLYGTIEFTDKSMKATKGNEGAFVSIMEAELEGLKRAAKFNHSRMLYGDGVGILTTAKAATAAVVIPVNSIQYLIEGLTIDILDASTFAPITNGSQRRIKNITRGASPSITLDTEGGNITTAGTELITVQQSYNMEITGLKSIFKADGTLYGVNKAENYWMVPYLKGSVGTIKDTIIQAAIDDLEDRAGSKTNFILCSRGVSRAYQDYMEATKRNVNTLSLKGGFESLSYKNMPLVGSKFAQPGTMKLLDTSMFKFHHMGDWDWMDGANGVLNQVAGKPVWGATLVRYMEMICDLPGGQGELSGISES